MYSITLSELPVPKVHQYLLGSIGPRPICFASTIDEQGRPNLSPFSFFNVFSANPPIVVFSPARSGRTGQTKDTHENCKEVPEVVINVVTYDMVQQMNLSSSHYERGVNEFIKSGFTMLESDLVKPFRVAESPVQMECRVLEIKELGEQGAAGNLIICEVLKMHFDTAILNSEQFVDQTKIDLVARMGGDWYCRAHGEALFEVPKQMTRRGIGMDQLPEFILKHPALSKNDLGMLACVEQLPTMENIDQAPELGGEELVTKSKELLQAHRMDEALALLMKNLG